MIEVQLLLEEADTKTVALERVADLEDELSYVGNVDLEIKKSVCYVRDMHPHFFLNREFDQIDHGIPIHKCKFLKSKSVWTKFSKKFSGFVQNFDVFSYFDVLFAGQRG